MLIPVLILIFLISTKQDSMQRVFSQQTLDALSISNRYMKKSTRNVLFFMALILMILALARPVSNPKEVNIKQEITPIVVAIDVSKSMLANDIFPNRLSMAKNKLKAIIKNSQHNAIGVLLFAKSAFILSPVTQDFNSLNYLVDNFDNGLNFDNGSNIFALLEASKKLLSSYTNKNVLILTDGANKDDFDEEITYANENNLHIYTLALATKKPTPIKIKDQYLTDSQGNIVTVKLNENIKELSLQTQGAYINFSLDTQDIVAILNDIESQSNKEQLKQKKYKIYTELFYYPLGAALILLLVAFSSLPRKTAAILFFCTFLYQDPLYSDILDFQTINEANEAYKNKQYKEASQGFEKVNSTIQAHYNLGNALYKQQKYKEALTQYKKVVTSNEHINYQKLHNMGNTYAKLGQLKDAKKMYEDAKKMYEDALKIHKDTQTQENLEAVNKALQKQQKKDNKSKNKKNQKNQDKKNQSKQEKQKNKSQKDTQKSEEKSKEKQKDKTDSAKKSQKQSKQKAQKNQDKKGQKAQSNENEALKNTPISKREEEKWLKQLSKQKAPVFMHKVKSSKPQEESNSPW